MKQWHDILRDVLLNGERRQDRTGVGTVALFGKHLEFDCAGKFPAVTTKRLAFGQMAAELTCFLKAHDSLGQFRAEGCRIWDGNGEDTRWKRQARFEGDLGRIYGVQWRRWRGITTNPSTGDPEGFFETDQLRAVVDGIKRDPHGRRHLVTAWNPGELHEVCLPPCHVMFQLFATADHLDAHVVMRSVDLFLGLPFDVASYALLLALIAKETCRAPRRLHFFLGDAHIYLNHREQVAQVLSREPHPSPVLVLDGGAGIDNFDRTMAYLDHYQHYGSVEAPLNV
jgi:thymidylate synthase